MNDKNFFDTNVIVYLYSEDEKRKNNISQKIVNTPENRQCYFFQVLSFKVDSWWFLLKAN